MVRAHACLLLTASTALLAACAVHDGATSLTAPRTPASGKTVAVTDPTASFQFPLDDAALGLRSDRLFSSGTNSVYADGVCGVTARIFATTAASNSGDATMQTDNPRASDRRCAQYPRELVIDYGDGVARSQTVFMNLHQLQNTGDYRIPVGDSALKILTLDDGRCGGLRWRPVLTDGTVTGADQVWVHRTNDSTWTVESQPAPNDSVYCINEARTFRIPVRFTVVANRKLP
jgi:hypothetical protein